MQSAIAQAQANLTNFGCFQLGLTKKIAANQQRIAEIDTQLGKQIMANDKQLADRQQNLKYH